MDEKEFLRKFMALVIAVTIIWVAFLIVGCIAAFDIIKSYAGEPSIIINGQYVNSQADALEIMEVPPINRISEALDDIDTLAQPELEYLGTFKITYYCPCKACNGSWGAIDRFGNPLVWGTVAVDPAVIPLGTHLVIDGYDADFVARDTGGKWVKGQHIDVFVPVSHSEALRMAQGERLKVWRVK